MKISSFFTFKNWHPDFGSCQPPMDGDTEDGQRVMCKNVVTLSVEENDPLPPIYRMMGR
jgi:hypothetical protein